MIIEANMKHYLLDDFKIFFFIEFDVYLIYISITTNISEINSILFVHMHDIDIFC